MRVFVVGRIERVKAQQANVARQPPQMYIEDKARLEQGLGAQVDKRGNLQRFEHRIHRHALAAAEPVVETYRRAAGRKSLSS